MRYPNIVDAGSHDSEIDSACQFYFSFIPLSCEMMNTPVSPQIWSIFVSAGSEYSSFLHIVHEWPQMCRVVTGFRSEWIPYN